MLSQLQTLPPPSMSNPCKLQSFSYLVHPDDHLSMHLSRPTPTGVVAVCSLDGRVQDRRKHKIAMLPGMESARQQDHQRALAAAS